MNRVKWYIIQIVTGLHVVHFVECFSLVPTKVETACAGRCSYQYSLQCPLSQKIALHNVEYASKVNTNCPNVKESCQRKDQCCLYDSGDCRIPFSDSIASTVYTKCSGKQECLDLRADQISVSQRCHYRNYSNYVAASYTCVNDDTFIDICSNGTVYGKAINLILNGSQPFHTGFENSNLCACVVSTSDCDSSARLVFQAVDVRLHQNNDITRCHPHSAFDITDGQYNSRPRTYKCASNRFYRNFIDLYYSRKPYARISLYNKPELNISQLWLNIKATLPDIDVMVTCGAGAVYNANRNVCVPPEFYPTTTPVHTLHTTRGVKPTEDKDPNSGNIGKQSTVIPLKPIEDPNSGNIGKQTTDIIPIVSGAIAAVVIVSLLIVLVVCCRRRRRRRTKKEDEDRFSHCLSVTSPQPLPTPVDNDYEGYEGNYYDSVGNGGTFTPSPFVQPVTPGKNMGSFFPTEPKKISPPIVPVVPPALPSNPPTELQSPSYDRDSNPYQQPWDGKPLPTPNRLKKSDLAYATSEEIQVLIQRMDNERKQLNEGETCTSPTGFIHIDDYKLSKSMTEKDKDIKEEDENDDDGDEEEDDDNEDDDNLRLSENRNSSVMHDDRHLPEHVHIDPHDVMCSSEDTGYRSVGSQEHILVTEDDYLMPKTRKEESSLPQRQSSQDKSSKRSSSSEDRNSVNKDQYADVYDALENGKTIDVKTKF